VLRIRDVTRIWIFPHPGSATLISYTIFENIWKIKMETHFCLQTNQNWQLFFTFSSSHQNISIFNSKTVLILAEVMDPGSGENLSQIQGSKSHRILDPCSRICNTVGNICLVFFSQKYDFDSDTWWPKRLIPYQVEIIPGSTTLLWFNKSLLPVVCCIYIWIRLKYTYVRRISCTRTALVCKHDCVRCTRVCMHNCVLEALRWVSYA